MNKTILIGNICNEPESRTTQSGIATATFRLAVPRRFKNANGQRESDFLDVVAWRQTAEYVTKYLHKGNKVAVEGSIQTRSYEAQDGSKRHVTEIIADSVEGMEGRKEAASQAPEGFTEVQDEKLPWE